MPAGTCHICGCTESHACPRGCSWYEPTRDVCNQCVGWTVLNKPHPYASVFAHDLVPVRNYLPELVWCGPTKGQKLALFLDARRLDGTTLNQLAFVLASINGRLAEEALADLHDKPWVFPIDLNCTAATFTAETREKAEAMAEEFRHTGNVEASVRVEVVVTQKPAATGGNARG